MTAPLPISVNFKTPCGFEIWLIKMAGDCALRIRVWFGAEEITLDKINCHLSPAGALMLADHLKQLYGETPCPA